MNNELKEYKENSFDETKVLFDKYKDILTEV